MPDEPIQKGLDPFEHQPLSEVGLHPRPAGTPEGFGLGPIRKERGKGIGQRGRIPGWNQQPRLAMDHSLGCSPDIGGHHRQAGRHGLEDGVRHTFGDRTLHIKIHFSQERSHVAVLPNETNARQNAESMGQRP